MKKRVLALLLCVCLVALMVPPLPAQAATAAEDAKAYLDVLNSTNPSSSYLVDFDGDGRDELITTYVYVDYQGSYSVYQGSQILLDHAQWTAVANLEAASVCSKDGTYYICSDSNVFSTLRDGEWVDLYGDYLYGEPVAYLGSDPEFSEEELAAIEYIADGQRVSEDEYYRQISFFKFEFSLDETTQDVVPNVRPQLEAIVEEARYADMTPGELLAEMAYVGDRSVCRMTAQQAEAFAAVAEQKKESFDRSVAAQGRSMSQFKIALFDGGDGVPAMWVVGSVVDDDIWSRHLINEVWEWDGTQAVISLLSMPEKLTDKGFLYSGAVEYSLHRLTDLGTGFDPSSSFTALFPLRQGRVAQEPSHIRADLVAFPSSFPAEGGTPEEVCWWELTSCDGLEWNSWFSVSMFDRNTFRLIGTDEFGEEYYDATYTGPAGDIPQNKVILEIPDQWDMGPNWADGPILSSLLRAYASANLAPVYPQFTDILGTGWESEPVQAASAAGGDVVACYSLTDGMCYVILQTEDGYRGVLVQASRQKGQVVWTAVRTDAEPTDQETLAAEVSRFLGASNVTVDFGRLRQGQSANELAEYLRVLLADMTGKGPNDLAKSDLAAFVDGAVSSLTTRTVKGKKNVLRIGQDVLSDLSREGRSALETLGGALENNGVTLNKTLTPTVRALWEDVDLSKPCQIELDREAARALEDCDLQLLLGDARTYLRLAAKDLTTLARDLGGSLRVQFSQEEEGVYAIRFLNKEGEVVDQLSCPVTVSLPAGSALDTIMVSYAGGSDNWGGQYDPAAGAISFDARYSGQYEVLENNVAINDIGELSDESRAAISFMVSKGYLGADNGAFRPGEPLTRYEFTEALVGMFFALDRELTTDFPDVEPTSRYYPYVASAQAKSIVNGYDNGTFSGDDPINREQVFALAARTLMEQKGYAQPADSEVYLSSFNDRSELSPWAAPQVALAVREGIAGRGAVLLPKANITREQAAVVLYRLFQLLYEVSPVSLELPGGGGGFPLPAVIGIGAGALAIGGVAVAVILLRKKKQTPVG